MPTASLDVVGVGDEGRREDQRVAGGAREHTTVERGRLRARRAGPVRRRRVRVRCRRRGRGCGCSRPRAQGQRLGLDVPRDLSIVGFDDPERASHVQPALTTVHVPAEALWRRASQRALAMLRGEPPAREMPIDVSLVVRGSTAPPTSRGRARR